MPHSVAAGLGLHYLPMSHKKDAMLLWVNEFIKCEETKFAIACDFQQCGILTCVDSDEPLQPPLKLRNSKTYSVS